MSLQIDIPNQNSNKVDTVLAHTFNIFLIFRRQNLKILVFINKKVFIAIALLPIFLISSSNLKR
jgi:hypothetical protein